MPFNRKSPKVKSTRTTAQLQEPARSVTFFDTLVPRPAPIGVDIWENLDTGITLVRMSNGLYYREDCQHWVRDPFGLNPDCRYKCPTPVEQERALIEQMRGTAS